MPWLILVGHTTTCNDLVALHAASCKLLFIAGGTVDFLLTGDEALGADGSFADTATETFLMPLACLILHLLCASSEDLSAAIAARSELGIIAIAAVDLVSFGPKLLIYQGHTALVAQEAGLMPVLVFVGQILGVDSDRLVAFFADIGEYRLVALDAVRVVIP